jgi:exosome complex component RRP43
MIDLEQLCIEEGKAAFRLRISILVLSDAGNLFDAIVLSLVSALQDVKLPDTMIDENSGDVSISDNFMYPLKLSKTPIAVTIGMFNDNIITDLDEKEEPLMHGLITIVFDEHDNICYLSQNACCAMKDQRPGFSFQTMQNAIVACRNKANEIRYTFFK